MQRPSRVRHIEARRRRIRARVRGTVERPRLSVFRSSRHLLAQLIDDTAGRTLLAVSDAHLPKGSATKPAKGASLSRGFAVAFSVGSLLAERAREKGIIRVVFDRGGRAYHGRIKAVAEGARAGGLQL